MVFEICITIIMVGILLAVAINICKQFTESQSQPPERQRQAEPPPQAEPERQAQPERQRQAIAYQPPPIQYAPPQQQQQPVIYYQQAPPAGYQQPGYHYQQPINGNTEFTPELFWKALEIARLMQRGGR